MPALPNTCSSVSITSICNDGTFSPSPYSYNSCSQGGTYCPPNTVGDTTDGYTCYCTAEAVTANTWVWGSSPYTSDSNLCRAAKHHGLTIPGNVTWDGDGSYDSYTGSTQNGITTSPYGPWPESFYFY